MGKRGEQSLTCPARYSQVAEPVIPSDLGSVTLSYTYWSLTSLDHKLDLMCQHAYEAVSACP